MILTEEGYVTVSGTPTYHYYLKDHQGNNRVVINQSGAVQQVNHYYPFGGLFGEGVQTLNQPYKYNGKELDRQLGLDMYDYGARHYDAALGRWFTADPHAENYNNISLYVYVANNPVRFIDPTGRDILGIDKEGKIKYRIKDTTQDTFYMIDEIGEEVFITDRISFEYGTIESQRSISFSPDGKTIDTYDVYRVRGDDAGSKLFTFMADNITGSTGVEFSHIKTGEEGDKGLNFITTSHEIHKESGGKYLINGQLRNGYYIREFTHSHPTYAYPSGLRDGSSDMSVIRSISNINEFWGTKEPKYYIYHVPTKQMIQFSIKSKSSDFGLIP